MRRMAWAMAVLVLAGCGGPPPTPPSGARVDGAQCLGALADRGTAFAREADFRNGRGCGIATAVSLRGNTAPLNRPVTVNCGLALALDDFERGVMQPAARRHFGQPVTRIHHLGAYVCRGRSGNAGRLSEHAFGRAIDLYAFELADGRIVRVPDHWHDRGRRGAFLHEIARGACGVFGVVLTPNHDADHHDHLHFDIGPWRLCGV